MEVEMLEKPKSCNLTKTSTNSCNRKLFSPVIVITIDNRHCHCHRHRYW